MYKKDLTGTRYGRLIASKYSHTTNRRTYWECVCDCGQSCVVRADRLKAGSTASCGCIKHPTKMSCKIDRLLEYNTWSAMVQRCENRSAANYRNYGGRGVTVCTEWSSFENFYNDMGPRPSKEYSLDRIDNDGPYCKENCRWATRKEQANNKRSNVVLVFEGEALTLTQWSEKLQISREALKSRIRSGWSVEEAIKTKVRGRKK